MCSRQVSLAQAATPDVMPKFPGGNAELYKFLNAKMSYTNEDKEQQVAGELILTFMVDSTGAVSQIEVKKGVSSKIDAEAKRIVSIMPLWIPARTDGQPVTSRFSLSMLVNSESGTVNPVLW